MPRQARRFLRTPGEHVPTSPEEEAAKPRTYRTRSKTKSNAKDKARTRAGTRASGISAMCVDPKTFKEAMASPQLKEWQKAMDEEIASLEESETWDLVKKEAGTRALHSKWVYKTKKLGNGEVERYKVRMVACGNEQVFGRDFNVTFCGQARVGDVGDLEGASATRRYAKRVRQG